METGDTIGNGSANRDQSSLPIEGNHLFINLRYDGLRVLLSDPAQKEVLEVGCTNWLAAKDPDYLIGECEKFFEQNLPDISKAAKVLWLFSVSKSALIPEAFYQQGNGEAILNQTSRLEVGDHIFSDFWTKRDIVGIYALAEKILKYIRSKNPSTSMAHNGFALNALFDLQPVQGDFCFLQVSKAFAELFIAKNGRVVFYNQFPHDVKEDLLYYLLFTLEQNRILAPEITLYTCGEIEKGDPFHQLLSKYIGKVENVKLPPTITAAKHIAPSQLRKAINLIAAL